MTRYQKDTSSESQHQPGSHGRVLKNLLGITRVRDIDQAEHDALLTVQEKYFHIITADTRFTAKLICDMHRHWLGKIYPWAGQYRSVEMSKDGFSWPPAFRVAQNMQHFEATLLYECTPCTPGLIEEVALRLAKVHAELLLIHPFREGNGRTGRWLAALMAAQANLPRPDFRLSGHRSTHRRITYISAMQRGYRQEYQPLADFFAEALARRAIGR